MFRLWLHLLLQVQLGPHWVELSPVRPSTGLPNMTSHPASTGGVIGVLQPLSERASNKPVPRTAMAKERVIEARGLTKFEPFGTSKGSLFQRRDAPTFRLSNHLERARPRQWQFGLPAGDLERLVQ